MYGDSSRHDGTRNPERRQGLRATVPFALVIHGTQRQPVHLFDQSLHGHRRLDGNGVRVEEQDHGTADTSAACSAPGLVPAARPAPPAPWLSRRAGTTLDATLITPRAPTAIMGSVSAVVAGQHRRCRSARRISLTRSTLPPASLTATTCGCSASRRSVSTAISRAGAARARCRARPAAPGRPRRRNGGTAPPGSACCSRASPAGCASAPASWACRVSSRPRPSNWRPCRR